MSAHRRIVAEAGLLGVVAVCIGIVRWREHRIDEIVPNPRLTLLHLEAVGEEVEQIALGEGEA